MPSIFSDNDRETVRRNVPKPGNKILAVAVARLYVAHPNTQRWTYTDLQGAVVLANDLVGNTFWLKLVDISPANKGVIWDQELYQGFSYNQDRTFFHSFELEDCLAGLSFADEKEAKTFKRKVDDREKNASKATRTTAFHARGEAPAIVQEKHGRFSNLLHRHKSPQPSMQPAQSIIPERIEIPTAKSETAMLDDVDPSWRSLLGDLIKMGITEEQIENNADFIKSYILDQRSNAHLDGTMSGAVSGPGKATSLPSTPSGVNRRSPSADGLPRRAGPPPLPAPRRTKAVAISTPPESPTRTPPPAQPRFRAPPPLTEAGRLAHTEVSAHPSRPSPAPSVAHAPPAPQRPPKTPLGEDDAAPKPRFAVPPPFQPLRTNAAPPPPPSRGAVPPPPPPPPPRSRQTSIAQAPLSPYMAPALPPKTPHESDPGAPLHPPPLPAQRVVPPPPAVLAGVPAAPPPPPALPGLSGPSAEAPPPPPPPPPPCASRESSAPPHSPGHDSGPVQSIPTASSDGRHNLLASIRANGGSGLKKVRETEKRDRSAAIVPGGASASPTAATNSTSSGTGGGLADALQQALSARNKKVSASDDEDDDEDWD